MQYIASKKIIHRDLAARNVLMFGNFVAKISDFGLCCFMDESLTYVASTIENLPIKWLALESLTEKIFCEKSDVWAFGILMYEIFTFGQIPHATKNDEELLEFLQADNRLERPDGVNDTLYEIMVGCWHKEAESRISFRELEEKFHEFIDIRNEVYGYVQPTFYDNMNQPGSVPTAVTISRI
jgi:serine/threonine protein kinase